MIFVTGAILLIIGAIISELDGELDMPKWLELSGSMSIIVGAICMVVSLLILAGRYLP